MTVSVSIHSTILWHCMLGCVSCIIKILLAGQYSSLVQLISTDVDTVIVLVCRLKQSYGDPLEEVVSVPN